MNRDRELLPTSSVQALIRLGMEPEFASLARLIKLAAEEGASAYYHENKQGSVQAYNLLHSKCSLQHQLTDKQMKELTSLMLDGILPFQMAARMAYENCDI